MPEITLVSCPYCKEEIREGAVKCKHCGEVLERSEYSKTANVRDSVPNASVKLHPYYQRVFAKFDANGGSFTPTWNWAAFLLGPIWYLLHGMWLKSVVLFVAWGFTPMFVFVPAVFVIGYQAIVGNYDYYLRKVKGKLLW